MIKAHWRDLISVGRDSDIYPGARVIVDLPFVMSCTFRQAPLVSDQVVVLLVEEIPTITTVVWQ